MKKVYLLPFLLLFSCVLGCGLLDRLKSGANENSNFNRPAAAPSVSATPTATATPSDSPTSFDKSSLGRNWLAFGSGAIVAAQTSESANTLSAARMLIDESGFEWQTADGQIADQSVTLELPARTTFKTFVFDTQQPTFYDGRVPKDVKIEVSDESATGGFQTVLETTLKDSENKTGADDQVFPVTKEIPARWVRYTAKNNDGASCCILTKELSGYGEQEPRAQIPSVSGTYNFQGISGKVHLKQEGSSIIGCYDESEGLIEGTIDGRVLTLVADEKVEREKGGKTWFIAANSVESGKTILSAWWNWSQAPQKKVSDRLHVGAKESDKIGNCKHLPDLDGKQDVVKDSLEKELDEKGKAILYGINFDFNSDVIKPESKPTLDKVIAILKEKPDWKFAVEGHTDNVGGDNFNQTLSEKRAASVVKYLTAAGIEQNRLSSKGYGLSRPLAPNNSEAERAQNRRVELVKQ